MMYSFSRPGQNLSRLVGRASARRCRPATPRVGRPTATRQKLDLELLETRTLLDAGLGNLAVVGADPTHFVQGLYQDLLQRDGGPAEVAAWVQSLDAGVAPAQVVQGFLAGHEYRSNLIQDTYWTLLGRSAEPAAVDSWLSRFDQGLTADQLTAGVAASAEYFHDQGDTDAGWLSAAYRDVLGRKPDAGGTASWGQVLQNGVSRLTVALGLEGSSEGQAQQVAVSYRLLLGRAPDAGGLAGWVGALGQGLTHEQLVTALATAPEYGQLATRTPAATAGLDVVLVQLKPGMEDAAHQVELLATADHAAVQGANVTGLFSVHTNASQRARLEAVLAGLPFVSYAEREQQVQVSLQPNDPSFVSGSQWGLNGTWGIQAPAAWDVTTGSASVVVADIDTGIDYNHPDLYKNVWINQAEIPPSRLQNLQHFDASGNPAPGPITFWDLNDSRNQGSFKITDVNGDGRIDAADILAPMKVDGSGNDTGLGGWANGTTRDGDTAHPDDFIGWNFVTNTNNPFDDHGHGTHTSGTIGAMTNDNLGVAGINWTTQIMACKFLDASGSGTDLGAAQAIRYAADHGARVSNNSWGGGSGGDTLSSAISYAGSKGQLFVAAAGNSGVNTDVTPNYPSSYNLPNILAVAAIDSTGALASFSNYGATTVTLGAPGVGILSTLPNSSYASWSGTSMATPHVTGTAALILAVHPTWTVSQVITQIEATTTPDAALSGKTVTGGVVNAAQAVAPLTVDLNWNGGGLTGPTALSTQTGFTLSRTYNIDGAAAPRNFTISYYASTSSVFDGTATLLGTETISAAADKAVGAHTGTSPSLQFSAPGTYYLYAQLNNPGTFNETNPNNNVGQAAAAVTVTAPDLNWVGGGLSGPTAVVTNTNFNLSRTYNIANVAAPTNFVLSYYASTKNVFDGTATLLGSETISAAVDKTVGTHTGTSPWLQISSAGTYYLYAQLDSGSAVVETDKTNNVAQAPQTVVASAPAAVLIDNGQAGYSETGTGWFSKTDQGYNTNLRAVAPGTGGNTATWQFSGLSGSYDVQVTWTPGSNRASNVAYKIYDGTTLLATITVNQQNTPTGPTVNGSVFQSIVGGIGPVTPSSGTLKVVISDKANGYVLADAVRIVTAQPPTTDLNWTGGGLTGPSTANTQTPFSVTRTYTVSGSAAPGPYTIGYYLSRDTTFGNADDVLVGTETLSKAADLAAGAHTGSSPLLQLNANGPAYLYARLNDSGTFFETNLTNNVTPNPLALTVSGPVVLDDGQWGFSETGSGWFSKTDQGYGGELQAVAPGKGSNTATWQVPGLASGTYDVQMTWTPGSSRATNDTYQIYDGSTLLGTVVINQQIAPNGPKINGSLFQSLGQFSVASGTLKVVLSDNANGYVLADALRASKVG